MEKDKMEDMIEKIVKKAMGREIMSLSLAVKLIEAVEQEAARQNLAVVIAVSDASGRPVAIHCMDGAFIGSFDVALNKTYTSVAFRMPTSRLEQLCRPGEELYGLQFTNEGKVVMLSGGIPLMVGDTMIGALGVSGASSQEDAQLAEYAASILKEEIKCLT